MSSKQNTFLSYFIPEKKKVKIAQGGPLGMGFCGFIAPELAQFIYAFITMLLIFFTWTNIEDPSTLMFKRITLLSGTIALWLVYQMWPCRLVMMFRVGYLLLLLGQWYPDTYELNNQFGCLDHIFANLDQKLFSCQPALLFSQKFSSAIVSELMYLGYISYYLFFVCCVAVVFIKDYKQVERVAFIILGSFFACYTIFILLPVTGPQYYYLAAGIDNIAAGVFPDVGNYFSNSIEALTSPGWSDGICYKICMLCHHSGERPTAAFPSSHVAIATLVMAIAIRMKMWRYLLILAVPYLFLCLSTVYIQAHYVVDAVAGFVAGVILFFIFGGMKLRPIQ